MRVGSGVFDMPFDKIFSALSSDSPFTPELRQHLSRVYLTLAFGCFAATVGVVTFLYTHINYFLPLILSMVSMYMLHVTDRARVKKRLGLFSLVCYAQGISLGGLIELALYVDSSLVAMALGTTIALFGGFTIAALTAKRRSYLYLGAMLYSFMGIMSIMSLMNIFFRSQMIWNVQLYGGLVAFSAYVIFDTQLMIEKFHSGNKDFISHALELFIDLASIFARVLIILLKNKENKQREQRRRKNEYR